MHKNVFALTKVNGTTIWTPVGVAFPPNRDGSVNIQLNCVPLSGRLQIREKNGDAKEPEAGNG